MKIEREAGPPIIVGKRVAIGQMIASCVTIGAFTWDSFNPEAPLPAGVVMGITQVVTGMIQMWVVNRHGVTQ